MCLNHALDGDVEAHWNPDQLVWDLQHRWNWKGAREQLTEIVGEWVGQMPLTVDTDLDPLGDTGRHSVRGDAQIRAHVQAGDSRQFQSLTLPLENCPWGRVVLCSGGRRNGC